MKDKNPEFLAPHVADLSRHVLLDVTQGVAVLIRERGTASLWTANLGRVSDLFRSTFEKLRGKGVAL